MPWVPIPETASPSRRGVSGIFQIETIRTFRSAGYFEFRFSVRRPDCLRSFPMRSKVMACRGRAIRAVEFVVPKALLGAERAVEPLPRQLFCDGGSPSACAASMADCMRAGGVEAQPPAVYRRSRTGQFKVLRRYGTGQQDALRTNARKSGRDRRAVCCVVIGMTVRLSVPCRFNGSEPDICFGMARPAERRILRPELSRDRRRDDCRSIPRYVLRSAAPRRENAWAR